MYRFTLVLLALSHPLLVRGGLIALYFEVCQVSSHAELLHTLRSLLASCVQAHLSSLTESNNTTPSTRDFSSIACTPFTLLQQLFAVDSSPALSAAVLALLHAAQTFGHAQYADASTLLPTLSFILVYLMRRLSLRRYYG